MTKDNIYEYRLKDFELHLKNDEKSQATVDKYLHDIRCFLKFLNDNYLEKAVVRVYKSELATKYAITSANSMLAALNTFLKFIGRQDCCVKQFKVQKKAFCTEDKELTRAEYIRLTRTASKKENERLNLILQTICATGIPELCASHSLLC